MSDNQPKAPTLLDPDTAYATVHQQVYAPVFFRKLANDFGISPETEKDALDMLVMAASLRQSWDEQQEKRGSAQSGLLAAAKEHLGIAMAEDASYPGQISPQVIEKAAKDRAADPALAHAVLSLQAGAAGVTPEQLA